ncbi:hypothetical protein BO78DRAFT_413547 [Aspergillus sclerotiicarbonarius CBS 121057]|uniref:Alpha/beta hydrolase fold-3 domain-containing protein n=1 Tax=Aspergillus sclerotiicarbonarius (strain CBS 121057 / IBT 28362) TaxID=1448318 RepID=A0A319EV98_ASPSB|nr:hypothetical protein BO78DRAFT_413547 [Aspergillus sclerotiicarbonarius CBS 121057]
MGKEHTSGTKARRWLSQRDILANEDLEWEEFYREHRSIVPHLTGSVDQFRQTMHQAKLRAQQHGRPIVHGLDVHDYTAVSQTDIKVSDNSRTHGFDGNKIYVGGTSAGANLAAVLCQLSPGIGIPIQGQLLRSPVLCSSELCHHRMGLKSMDEYIDTPILNRQSMKQFLDWYQPGDLERPIISPLLSFALDRSPPSFLLICGHDPLRDEALAYADELEKVCVPLRVAVYPGMPHAFWIFPELSTTKAATQDLISGVKWLVSQSKAQTEMWVSDQRVLM